MNKKIKFRTRPELTNHLRQLEKDGYLIRSKIKKSVDGKFSSLIVYTVNYGSIPSREMK